MINFHSYEFTTLRYVHDTLTGEFVNVGVVAYCKEQNWISAICRNTHSRISAVFPDLNSAHFRKMMKFIPSEFEAINKSLKSELQFKKIDGLATLLYRVLPKDDSALQWSAISSGLTFDLNEEISLLFERYVSHYDAKVTKARRTEQDIWKDFKKTLETFQICEELKPKKISVQDDEIEFQHSWRNGIWHCIEPLSFDLSDGDYFKDKAHRWLGQVSSVKNSSDKFKLYFLVSPPSEEGLNQEFEKALSILNKMPVENEIFLESDAILLAEEISKEMEAHNQSSY
ncbi:hypothetical protein SRABI130_02861 [Pseudomonas sp. Bi130]|uniref:DUF3037 domain-containing protein n=1 Tax=Pseudomonas sp. Bi130 TaxID=2821122 RepID=UPI001DD19198|nr:DUF3037 domain-containing protein [Pseudomonas sp. Bi130]CAH0235742.1 hypothetical protein SRABI130_02861 [Pseudomonas sp. Bi130]